MELLESLGDYLRGRTSYYICSVNYTDDKLKLKNQVEWALRLILFFIVQLQTKNRTLEAHKKIFQKKLVLTKTMHYLYF